ncbi:MAG: hypothetical protein MI923_21355 [Phycisphaerales bacterium]|nr:hypothetical protein [Phycisphaerales bacterium]
MSRDRHIATVDIFGEDTFLGDGPFLEVNGGRGLNFFVSERVQNEFRLFERLLEFFEQSGDVHFFLKSAMVVEISAEFLQAAYLGTSPILSSRLTATMSTITSG